MLWKINNLTNLNEMLRTDRKCVENHNFIEGKYSNLKIYWSKIFVIGYFEYLRIFVSNPKQI